MHIRHFLYDKGILKSFPTDVPSLCIGNVAVGGTGKTPMTELVLKTLLENDVPAADAEIYGFEPDTLFFRRREHIAVLSRGYKRKSKGFRQVTADGTALQFGDEPLQIKKKYPDVTVAVDADRVRGCALLAEADVIVLDDAYQYRRIRANRNIALTTYSRPFYSDYLLPVGRLRDLRSRMKKADMIVVTKCPTYLSDAERMALAGRIGLKDFDMERCEGINSDGKVQKLLFSTIVYDGLVPVFPEGDLRYTHSKAAILFTGIADDTNYEKWLSKMYRIVSHRRYADHHVYSASDIGALSADSDKNRIAVVVTTEKDAQRLMDIRDIIDENLRSRLFYSPIHAQMLTAAEQSCLRDFLSGLNN